MDVLILVVLAFVVALSLIQRAQVAAALRSYVWHPDALEMSNSGLRPYEHEMLYGAETELARLGFERSGVLRSEHAENGVSSETRLVVYASRSTASYAFLSAAPVPDAAQKYHLTFCTEWEDGTILRTVNFPSLAVFPRPSGELARFHYEDSVSGQWDTHQAAVAQEAPQHGALLSVPSLATIVESEKRRRSAALEKGVADGEWEAIDGGRYRFVRSAAWRNASVLIKENNSMLRRRRDRFAKSTAPVQPVPLEAEVSAYGHLSSVRERRGAQLAAKWLLFFITAGLFLGSFGLTLSFTSVLILLATILFHELGHVAAMWFFGFGNLQIIFLPFLGAVALGRQRNIPTYQRVLIALAGPLPGLVAGLVLLAVSTAWGFADAPIVQEATGCLLALNFFNLLPIMPLDGGQVLHALLFCRFPILEALFIIVGGVILAVVGYAVGQPVLSLAALLILVNTQEQMRRTRLLLTLRKKLRAERVEEATLPRRIFVHLSENGFEQVSFQRRFQLADYLLENARAPMSGVLTSTLLFVLYLASVALLPAFFAFGYADEHDDAPPVIHRVEPDAGAGQETPVEQSELLRV